MATDLRLSVAAVLEQRRPFRAEHCFGSREAIGGALRHGDVAKLNDFNFRAGGHEQSAPVAAEVRGERIGCHKAAPDLVAGLQVPQPHGARIVAAGLARAGGDEKTHIWRESEAGDGFRPAALELFSIAV